MSKKKAKNDGEPKIQLSVVLVEATFGPTKGDVRLSEATVEAQLTEKIASVKASLRRITERTVLSLYYRGIRCEPTRTVEYYQGLGNGGVWQARLMKQIEPTDSKIAVEIMHESKKTVLMVPSSLSLHAFKDVLYHRLGFPPEEQHILANNKAVRGAASLTDYIKKATTSMLLLYETEKEETSRKFINFTRNLIEPVHKAKSSDATKHSEIVSGLNIEGICCTPSCRIFGQTAVYALGQEVFDMCIDAALCPCCKAEMHITNAGFHDCAWRIQGVKKHGEHEQIVKTIARQTGDGYVRCDPTKCRTPGKWHRLMLQAVPLKCAKQCAVCRSSCEEEERLTSLCGEVFHSACYEAWKQLELRCPSCLQHLQT